MSRAFCSSDNCECFFEGFGVTAGAKVDDFIEEASEYVYANITEFHPAPSTALPATGTSPNYWVRTATANEAIFLSLNRRMKTSQEEEAGYWSSFHTEAVTILADIYDGKHRLDPDPLLSEKGIGVIEAIANGTYTVGTSNWLESNSCVPMSTYEDDVYSRIYYIEIESVGSTLQTSTFKWKTNMTETTSGWENTGIKMSYSFLYLSHGVEVRFLSDGFDSFEVGMMWKIPCYPERDSKQRSSATSSTVYLERG